MLTPLDDSPWHQIADTFDHVGPSDPRFFDRLWFAASDPAGRGTLQFTLGVYQNMNVVDGGFVVIHDGKQHNVRASRRLRPRYEIDVPPLAIEVVEPMQHLHLSVAPGAHGIAAELDWHAALEPEEEPQHFGRRDGRVVEDYKRMDQIGVCRGWFDVGGGRVALDDWWACRDHSWGVRERVGIPEPATNEAPERPAGSFFAFLFYATGDAANGYGGHVQVAGTPGHSSTSVRIARRDGTAVPLTGVPVTVAAEFADDGRPRRIRRGRFGVGADTTIEVEALGAAVAMPGLGYGGYDDGLGLGVYRGMAHLEHDVWDVTHPAEVVLGGEGRDRVVTRPVHRIQPVRVTQTGPDGTSEGTGSLTFIAEGDLVDLGVAPL